MRLVSPTLTIALLMLAACAPGTLRESPGPADTPQIANVTQLTFDGGNGV